MAKFRSIITNLTICVGSTLVRFEDWRDRTGLGYVCVSDEIAEGVRKDALFGSIITEEAEPIIAEAAVVDEASSEEEQSNVYTDINNCQGAIKVLKELGYNGKTLRSKVEIIDAAMSMGVSFPNL